MRQIRIKFILFDLPVRLELDPTQQVTLSATNPTSNPTF